MREGGSQRILVIGATGMLGHAMFRYFSELEEFETFGTLRSAAGRRHFPQSLADQLIPGINVQDDSDLLAVFADVKPDIVINCVGIIKQLDAAKNHMISLAINAMLPHRLAQLCRLCGARLIHPSTDCVFSGRAGGYVETDAPDADDLYGRSKLLGEVDYAHAITLRTSIIGHELESTRSLIDWFLAQEGTVGGFTHAVFSGLPTVELARIVHEYVLPNPELRGVYHVSADPIDKFTLLSLVAEEYGKQIKILPKADPVIDRSLNSERFRTATGFKPLSWPALIARMHQHIDT